LSKYKRIKVDALLDSKNKDAKISFTDLRDIEALLEKNHLPPEQQMNISWSKTVLTKNTYEMQLSGTNSLKDIPPQLALFEAPNPPNDEFGLISLGMIDKKLLSENRKPVLSNIDSNGNSLLLIEVTSNGQNAPKGTIECDPSLGYRFRRIEWRSNGKLIRETIADDYRDIKGTPYPFIYIDRTFDKDEKILVETKYTFDKVELGVDLSPSDFKILVPDKTIFTDAFLSMSRQEIEKGDYMGIADVLNIEAQKLALKELVNLNSVPLNQKPEDPNRSPKVIFIPQVKIAQKKGIPFVFDLATGSFVNIPQEENFHSEQIYNYLTKLGKGDIAWDDSLSLVILRNGTILDEKQSSDRFLKFTKTKWTCICKLYENIELPYELPLIHRENADYQLVLQKIDTDGIFISYTKLNSYQIKNRN